MEALQQNIDILKLGTNLLTVRQRDVPVGINTGVMQRIARQIKAAGPEDPQPVIVTSAAIAAGMIDVGAKIRPDKDTEEGMMNLQRFFSIGWRTLHNHWDKAMSGITTGGLLLTRQEINPDDVTHAQERKEALRTIYGLLRHGEVPIIDENDPVSHEEITFGDNDILAALLAVSMSRSPLFEGRVRLFLMSNTDGVYEDMHDPDSRIPVIHNTNLYRHLADDSESQNGTGGMKSKFAAADIAHAASIDMWLYDPRTGNGHRDQAVRGEVGTYFPAPTPYVLASDTIISS